VGIDAFSLHGKVLGEGDDAVDFLLFGEPVLKAVSVDGANLETSLREATVGIILAQEDSVFGS
jgi:hypothetical protein